MSAPKRQLTLDELIKQWWITGNNLQALDNERDRLQQTRSETFIDLCKLEEDIDKKCSTWGQSRIFKMADGVYVLLAWQEKKEYHTVELLEIP